VRVHAHVESFEAWGRTEGGSVTKEFLTPGEVAELLRLGQSTIYRALTEGRLPGIKPLGRWRIPGDELEQWVRDQRPMPRSNGADPVSKRPPGSGSAERLLAEVAELRRRAS